MNGLIESKNISRHWLTMTVFTLVLVASLANTAFSQQRSESVTLTTEDPAVRRVMDVQDRFTKTLMAFENVNGTGTGLSESGELTIMIFTVDDRDMPLLPTELEGIPVERKVIGEVRPAIPEETPMLEKGSSVNAVTALARPVPIGSSTGNGMDCSIGTIGVRVKRGNARFAISCNHVFARQNSAAINEPIMQPGRADIGCAYSAADTVGRLADYQPMAIGGANNTMDAAMVSTTTSLISASTPANGYGAPSATTVSGALQMNVKKYGKTTGLTTGKIAALNVTISISYAAGLVTFSGQIIVEGNGFVQGGDSGSLVVTNNSTNNPVGLAFARSGSWYTFVTPINVILTRFNVQIDDGAPSLLPVELSTFSGQLKNESVYLKWRTETELHNYGFMVQRSNDKETWEDASFVPGAGESYSPRDYDYVDFNIAKQFAGTTLYYRLLQIDRDGTQDYSSVLEIKQRPTDVVMNVYPHPVRDEATVQLLLSEPTVGSLNIYDASGRRIESLSRNVNLSNGSHVLPLSATSLTSGSYYLEIATSYGVLRKHMIVSR